MPIAIAIEILEENSDSFLCGCVHHPGIPRKFRGDYNVNKLKQLHDTVINLFGDVFEFWFFLFNMYFFSGYMKTPTKLREPSISIDNERDSFITA